MTSPAQISVKQLSRPVGTPAAPVLLDVRIAEDIALDPQYLPCAVHCPHHSVREHVPKLIGKRVVVYCQKSLKLSEGAAAILRANGVQSEVLEGGHLAWRDASLPMVPFDKIPPRNNDGHTHTSED